MSMIEKKVDDINKFFSSNIAIERPIDSFPYANLVLGKAEQDGFAIVTLMALLNSIVMQGNQQLINDLGEDFDHILNFSNERPSGSFAPMFADLANLKYALEDYSPDLILEIGGGVSSTLFSRYAFKHNIPYYLVDPDKSWANNTISILEKMSNICPPKFIDLRVQNISREIFITNSAITTPRLINNPEFVYDSVELNDALEACKKPLIYLDGAPKNSYFLGAEFILNKQLRSLMSGGICLVDSRPRGAYLLSQKTKNIYTTHMELVNHQRSTPKLYSNWQLFEDLSFSAFQL